MSVKAIKIAAMVVALLISLATGLYGIDSTYVRQTAFSAHVVQQMEDEAFRLQQRIWDYEDRLKEEPTQAQRRELEIRIRELLEKKRQIEERIRRGG